MGSFGRWLRVQRHRFPCSSCLLATWSALVYKVNPAAAILPVLRSGQLAGGRGLVSADVRQVPRELQELAERGEKACAQLHDLLNRPGAKVEEALLQKFIDGSNEVLLSAESSAAPLQARLAKCLLAFAKQGDIKGARMWHSATLKRYPQQRQLLATGLAHVLAKAGDFEGAKLWLPEAGAQDLLVTADARSAKAGTAAMYNALMDTAADAGKVAQAEAWFDTMIQAGVAPSSKEKAHLYTTLIKASMRASGTARAEYWFSRARAEHSQNLPMANAMMAAYAKAGNTSQAEVAMAGLARASLKPDLISFASLIEAYSRAGQVEDALEWLRKLRAAGFQEGVVVLTSLVSCCSRARPKAAALAEKLLRDAVARKVSINKYTLSALRRAVGARRAWELCTEPEVARALRLEGAELLQLQREAAA